MRFNFIKLNKPFLKENIESFIQLGRQIPLDYWTIDNYIIDIHMKWNYSMYIEFNNQIVGFMIATRKLDAFYINRIVVDKDFRGRKLGDNLLREAIQIGKGNNCNKIALKVHKQNSVALKWYLKRLFLNSSKNNDYLELELKIEL
jgi:ribosomal protein S18 acetylase RimI-like enzyme